NGRLTGSEQFITAVTTTVEYRMPYRWTNTILRTEHRFDESRGPGGGFFAGGEIGPGVVGLTPAQHLLMFSAIWTFDSP
ncbi:MAG: porin, partial [Nitrospirota bacterium]|nr:porin [Nitrospirota bacterium]